MRFDCEDEKVMTDVVLVSRLRLQEQDVGLHHVLPATTRLLLLQPGRLPRHLLLPSVSAILLLLQQLPSLPDLSL